MVQKLIKLFRETWFFWVYWICYGFLTARETDAAPMPRWAGLLISLAFSVLLTIWVTADARRRERTIGYGFPALVFVLWPIFVPIYLFQTRGARAFLSLLAFIVITLISVFVGAVGAAVIQD